MAVAAAWSIIALLLIKLFELNDPRGQAIVLAAPLVAAFVARVRLSPGLEAGVIAISISWAALLLLKDWISYRNQTAEIYRTSRVDAGLQALLVELADQFKMRAPQLRVSEQASCPFMTGWLKPLIVLPASVAESLSRDELSVLLAHELAHVKRLDFLSKWVLLFVTRLSWLNPIASGLYRRIGFELECASDRLASEVTGMPGTLARTLVKADRLISAHPHGPAANLVVGACSSLEARIAHLAQPGRAGNVRVKVGLILGTLMPMCFKIAPAWLLLATL